MWKITWASITHSLLGEREPERERNLESHNFNINPGGDFEYELLICYKQAKQAESYFQLSYEMQSHGQVAYISLSYLVKRFF